MLLLLVVGSLLVGRYPQPGFLPPALLLEDDLALRLVLDLRLPRVIAALLLGACLGLSGLVLQMLFGNPIVEPGLIGVTQGAAFGAALAIVVLSPPLWLAQFLAMVTGGLGLFVSYRVARRLRFGGWILRLVLSGIAVSALFSAGVGLLKFLADPLDQLPSLTFWLLGGLSATTWPRLAQVAPIATVGAVTMVVLRWRLNLLALEDRVSFSLGSAPQRERMVLLAAATAATAAMVSLAGIVAWVGLLVPHMARRIVGADATRAVPWSAVLGAAFVLVADTIARTVTAGEIPLGVLTSLFGAAGFLWLLSRSQVRVVR